MIWIGLAGVAAFAVWWFWLSAPSRETVDGIRRAFIEGPEQARAKIEAVPKRFRLEVLFQVMRDLVMDDEHEAGRLALIEVAALDPVAATHHAELLAGATGDTELGIDICRKALAASPQSVSAMASLARILSDAGRYDEALDTLDARRNEPDLLAIRAEVLERLGRVDEALAIADALEGFGAAERNRLIDAEDRLRAEQLRRFGADIRREAEAALDPDFDPLADLARSGDLRARSGANHWLIGLRIRADQDPEEALLQHPTAMARRAFDRLEQASDDRDALCAAGEAQLRTRDAARAVPLFERVVRRDPSDFVGQLGFGAALRCEEERWLSRLGDLPDANVPCPQHFPDLAALTEDEQRVVTASVGELAPLLSRAIRIRPLAHVPEPGESWVDAADLLDLSPEGWTLGHRVALDAYEALPEPALLALAALADEAAVRPELARDTGLDALPGLFAELWVRTLAVRWTGVPSDPLQLAFRRVLSAL
ncbi:MAG: tetratricopeptide repeat protein [Alphaproteobacteria bacterium]|nr:tetratricopeptide repeat protein [Alphaproteobacteria bacterium]